MQFQRLLTSSLRTMTRFKLRTFFIMVGVFVGVAALTVVLSVGTGVEEKVLATVGRLFSPSSIMVTSGGGFILSGPRGDAARLTLEDMDGIAAAVAEVAAFDPVQVLPEASVRYGDATTTARVLGCSERFERVWARGVSEGETFDAAAVGRSARVALIGHTAARELFAGGDALGAEILIGNVAFRVIGLLEPFGTDAHGMDRDAEIVVPISTVMRRLLNVDTIRGARVLVRAPEQVEVAAREIERLLRERHAIAAGEPNDFILTTPLEVQKMVATTQRVLFVFLPLVALVALLVAAVVAASLMLLSLNERLNEIGVRRAVGARASDIATQFLMETAATTAAGGVAGLIAGSLLAWLLARRIGLHSAVSLGAALLGLALSLAVGLAAGVWPARKAASLPPADALR